MFTDDSLDELFESSEMDEAIRRAEEAYAAATVSHASPPLPSPPQPLPPPLPPLESAVYAGPSCHLTQSPEWEAVAGCDLRPGQLMKVRAVAGAGKSTVLLDFMARRPLDPFLVLSYNAAIAGQLKARVANACSGPRGTGRVSVRTAHSLAFAATEFIHGRKRKAEVRQARHVASALGLHPSAVSPSLAAAAALAVDRFVSSSDALLGPAHVQGAGVAAAVALSRDAAAASSSSSSAGLSVLDAARRLWLAMSDPSRGDVALSHDGYMKCLQLDQARADAAFDAGRRDAMCSGGGGGGGGFGGGGGGGLSALSSLTDAAAAPLTIVLDEAQDCSDCIVSLVLSQRRRGTRVVAAFDEHQTIYQFRHCAGRALAAAPADHDLRLSGTFRFGAPLDRIATSAVRFFKGARGDGLDDDDDDGSGDDGDDSVVACTRDGASSVGVAVGLRARAAAVRPEPFLVRAASHPSTTVQEALEPPYLALLEGTRRAKTELTPDSVVCDPAVESTSSNSSLWRRPMAILARRNITLFRELVRVVVAAASLEGEATSLLEAPIQLRIHCVGGLDGAIGCGLSGALDVYWLKSGNPERCSSTKMMNWRGGFVAYQRWAEESRDSDALLKIAVVESAGPLGLPAVAARARELHCESIEDAALILCTIHKAKGLEFSRVYILGDIMTNDTTDLTGDVTSISEQRSCFPPLFWRMSSRVNHPPTTNHLFSPPFEEINLVYTAMTRAQDQLWFHPNTWAWLVPAGISHHAAAESAKSGAVGFDVGASAAAARNKATRNPAVAGWFSPAASESQAPPRAWFLPSPSEQSSPKKTCEPRATTPEGEPCTVKMTGLSSKDCITVLSDSDDGLESARPTPPSDENEDDVDDDGECAPRSEESDDTSDFDEGDRDGWHPSGPHPFEDDDWRSPSNVTLVTSAVKVAVLAMGPSLLTRTLGDTLAIVEVTLDDIEVAGSAFSINRVGGWAVWKSLARDVIKEKAFAMTALQETEAAARAKHVASQKAVSAKNGADSDSGEGDGEEAVVVEKVQTLDERLERRRCEALERGDLVAIDDDYGDDGGSSELQVWSAADDEVKKRVEAGATELAPKQARTVATKRPRSDESNDR